MTHPKPSFAQQVEEAAKEMGNRHANPIIRSMYPLTSRGDMSGQFAQLFSLGVHFAAPIAREEGKREGFELAINSLMSIDGDQIAYTMRELTIIGQRLGLLPKEGSDE